MPEQTTDICDSDGNVGVIGACTLVDYFNSMLPDIIVGLGIATLAVYFSISIIRESSCSIDSTTTTQCSDFHVLKWKTRMA